MNFNNLNDLFKHIEKNVQDALKDDVAEAVKETMADTIQQNVYNVYSPMIYTRRGEQGGLIDKRNMEATLNGDTLTVKDIAPLDNGRTDYDLDEIIENGWGNMPFARPFYGDAEETLKRTGDHTEALKQGLKRRGIDVK